MPQIIRSVGRVVALLATLVAPAVAQAPVYPYPGDASWMPVDRFWQLLTAPDGRAEITAARPYGGNGSLALHTTGNLFEWGFYATLSGRDPVTGQLLNPWGSLGDVSALSFAWRRDPVGVMGQATGWFVYVRNLWFLRTAGAAAADEAAA